MTYMTGQKVNIQTPSGENSIGTILYLADWLVGYWVQYTRDGIEDCTIFSTEDLDKWNTISISSSCVCGAEKVNSSRHSTWCDKYESKIYAT